MLSHGHQAGLDLCGSAGQWVTECPSLPSPFSPSSALMRRPYPSVILTRKVTSDGSRGAGREGSGLAQVLWGQLICLVLRVSPY